MPTSEAPTKVTDPSSKANAENGSRLVGLGLKSEWAERPALDEEAVEARSEAGPETESGGGVRSPIVRGSRWVDYETHELLETISQLEDERRWARLREGLWLAILLHFILLSALTWIPRYIFHIAPNMDPIEAIQNRKDLTYLDLPPDALRQFQPKVQVKPATPKPAPHVDKKTLQTLNTPPPPPAPAPEPPKEEPKLANPIPAQPAPAAPQPPADMPRPSAVPARPNFALGSQNPANQLGNIFTNSSGIALDVSAV